MIMNRGLVRQVEDGACLVDQAPLEPSGGVPNAASRRMAEAEALALGHVGQLQAALAQLTRLAADVADGGAAYPVGVRDICERLAEEVAGRSRQIQGVLFRGAEAAATRPALHA